MVEALVGSGHSVRVFDDLSSGSRTNLQHIASNYLELVVGDVRDASAVKRATAGVDGFFHLAAIASVAASIEQPLSCHAVNVGGTLHVLEAARTTRLPVVFASSAAVYGDLPQLPKTEAQPASPTSPYGVHKLAGEHFGHVASRLHGVPFIALRFFNVYGPRQTAHSEYAGVIAKFIALSAREQQVTIYGDGEQSRDFVFVADVARACMAAMERAADLKARVFNIAGGHGTSILELLRTLEPQGPSPRLCVGRAGDIRHSVADTAAARAALGFEPAVALSAGLELTRQWFEQVGYGGAG